MDTDLLGGKNSIISFNYINEMNFVISWIERSKIINNYMHIKFYYRITSTFLISLKYI